MTLLRGHYDAMSFDVSAQAYNDYMGRYSEPLAEQFLVFAGVRPGQRALDVGCGPGALTARLVDRLGAPAVSALDPSAPFVEAAKARFPDTQVQQGTAEQLPYADDEFDVVLAQLVVHFMTDPVAGLREMARVSRPAGTVAASVWDHGTGRGPSSLFWRAVSEVDPRTPGEAVRAGSREGHLGELARRAGLHDVVEDSLTVLVTYGSFEEWWRPYTYGVGPAGAYVAGLDDRAREVVRARCASLLPNGAFDVSASAWCVRGQA